MKPNTLLLTICLSAFAFSAHGQTVLIEEDFSDLPMDRDLEKSDAWWGPSWNNGDLAYINVNLDGPDGQAAITRNYEVFAGRWYGGGLRGQALEIPNPDTARNDADIDVSFWLKGTSTDTRGQVGFSLLGFDSSTGSDELTGAAYYLVPIAPEAWTEVTFSLDEADGGVPDHSTSEIGAIDWTITDKVQVFFWLRNELEQGWPTEEDASHMWSVSVADISITEAGGGSETYGGYPVVDGFVNMESSLGLLYIVADPWMYSVALDAWLFMQEPAEDAPGFWVYILAN